MTRSGAHSRHEDWNLRSKNSMEGISVGGMSAFGTPERSWLEINTRLDCFLAGNVHFEGTTV